ncbi:MAG: hypothetical protein KC613_11335, partial [Myxococcales bacterium]|nr:hypothetical protein [Myxococcales bacterium]
DWPEARIRLQGAAVAAGCGVRPSSVNQDLQRTPQGNLKITYGGRPVAIQGASFDGTRLRLSAGGIHCELEGRTDLFMDARLGDKFEPQVKVRVKGDLVDGDSSLVVAPQPPEGAPQSDWLTVTPGAEPTDAKAPWPLQVQGRFSVDGLPVVVDGQVQALRCR